MTTSIQANYNESFYIKIGSTWLLDGTFVYLISPIGFIGFFLNIISLLIFFKIKVKSQSQKLVKYLRVYSLNSSFICLIIGFTFVAYSPRYFLNLFKKYSAYFKCKMLNYILVCLYQYGISIDFLIVMDSISSHSNRLIFMKKINPYLICSFNFLLCLIINYPLATNFDRLKLHSNSDFVTKNCPKLFLITQNRVKYFIIALQDFLLAILIIFAIFMSFYFYAIRRNKSSSTNTNSNNQNGKKILILSQTLCLNTLICHLIILIGRYLFISFWLRVNDMESYVFVVCIICFIVSFKHSLNIILFYLYDSGFKENFINFNRRNYVAQYL